jgi:hypothetical protein
VVSPLEEQSVVDCLRWRSMHPPIAPASADRPEPPTWADPHNKTSKQVERIEVVSVPDPAGGLLRVARRAGLGIEQAGEPLVGSVGGPTGVTVGGERRPGPADLARERERLGGGLLLPQQHPAAGAAEVAEEQRYVESVAGAQGAIQRRRRCPPR